MLRTLYLLEQGLALSREGERLLVSRDAAEVSEIPVQKLDQLVVQGNSMVSTAALRLLAENDIGVYFADWRGAMQHAAECADTLDAVRGHERHGRAYLFFRAE